MMLISVKWAPVECVFHYSSSPSARVSHLPTGRVLYIVEKVECSSSKLEQMIKCRSSVLIPATEADASWIIYQSIWKLRSTVIHRDSSKWNIISCFTLTHIFQDFFLTWNTVTVAQSRESKFFLSGKVSPLFCCRPNLQPKRCIPRILKNIYTDTEKT